MLTINFFRKTTLIRTLKEHINYALFFIHKTYKIIYKYIRKYIDFYKHKCYTVFNIL